MNKAATISRGDLLRGLRGSLESDWPPLAAMLGFAIRPTAAPKSEPVPISPLPVRDEAPEPPVVRPPSPMPAVRSLSYLTPDFAWTEKPKPSKPGRDLVFTPEELRARPVDLPPKPALMRWARLWPFLRQALGCHRNSGRLDAGALTAMVATLKPVRRMPRIQRLTWAPRATVLLDLRSALTPFLDDIESLITRLEKWRPQGGLQLRWLSTGLAPESPPELSLNKPLVRVPGAPLLVLGDLGCLEYSNAALAAAWADWGLRLANEGWRLSALLPCPRDRWDQRVASIWRCSVWDRSERPKSDGRLPLTRSLAEQRASGTDRLLNWLSPALRCDPALLRELRLLLSNETADVGTEFDVWNSDPEVDRRGLAISISASTGIIRREKLAHSPDPLMPRVGGLIRFYHRGDSPTVRIKETLNLAACHAGISEDKKKSALEDQVRLAETALELVKNLGEGEVRDSGLVDYFRRDVRRTSADQIKDQSGLSIGYGVYRYFDGAAVEALPAAVDPEMIREVRERIQEPGKDMLWELRQQGGTFHLRRWHPRQVGQPISSLSLGAPLVWLWAGRPGFLMEAQIPGKGVVRHDLNLKNQLEARIQLGTPTSIFIQSDRMRVELQPEERPVWATRYGQDPFGRFAEFEIGDMRFPLRWIPPGSFQMGSPKTEQGRYENEGPRHQVTISRGFWLATTPCTQAQWRAVMRTQPSRSKGEDAPVESVSWNDCMKFCQRVAQKVQGLEFFLPTEAEWEYACRAGTDTAFNDGSDCTAPDGTDPALAKLGWHGQGVSGAPHPVGRLARNAWGLYDMHGNVYEWCQDGSRSYTTECGINPVGPTDEHAGRALRGGSCWGIARGCRSACRFEDGPDIRNSDVGFRLAAGQPGRSAALDLERGAEGRSPTGRSGRGAKAAGRIERPVWALLRFEEDLWGQVAEFELDRAVFRFRWIAPGTFLIGSPKEEAGRWGDEVQHRVTLTRGFWLGDTPCTQLQWEAVLGKNPSRFRGEENPVDSVSWDDCQKFLRRLAEQVPSLYPRLPSEAEWEYACRAGTTSAFNDGSDCTVPEGTDPALDRLGWYTKNSDGQTHPVRQKQPNRWGLFDMHGNVLEWCHDGRRDFTANDLVDPVGPTNEQAGRALRGGSYWYDARNCRSAFRLEYDPVIRINLIGFRLAAGQPVWSVALEPESGAKGRSPTGGSERGAPDRRRPKPKAK